MASFPFALSIHHFISSVGADAGFAAIIGLAILILLYFAQARETAALRTHADEAAKRIRHLEGRLAALTGAQSGAQQAQPAQVPSAAKAAAAGEPSPAGPRRTNPGAPAGVAAPALAAATRLIPSIAKRGQSPVQAAGPAVALAEPPSGRNPGGPAGANRPRATSATGTSRSAPPPATAAGAANGTQSRPRPAAASAAPRQAQPRTASAAPADTGGPRSWGRLRIALAALVVVCTVVALVLITGSNSGPSTGTAASSSGPRAGRHGTAGPRVAPSSVTVSVLNGTAVTGLAHRVALRLTGAGYREGTVATATDQTHPTTIVAYLPGFRRDALAVAHSLKVSPAAVQAVDQSSRTVACPPPSACTANVVVTVGTDLANTP